MAQGIEKKENKKSKYSLLSVSKIIIVITIVVGMVGVINTPGIKFNYFAESNIYYDISSWIIKIISLFVYIFLIIGLLKYVVALRNNNIENKKEAKKIIFYVLISLILLSIFYSFMRPIHVFI